MTRYKLTPKTISENTGLVELYFINPIKTHYILFQMKQCRQESKLKILIKNRERVNVKSTNFLGVITDSNPSWEVHTERTCSRININLFLINRLSKILEMNVRRMLYYGLIYPLLAYGINVWGQSVKALTKQIFTLQKRVVRYMAGLKQLESCRDRFEQLELLTVLPIYLRNNLICKRKV
jgi:hypothetical protein